MKFILKFLGGAGYCLVFAYFLWLLIGNFVPWLMGRGKVILIYYLLNGVFLMGCMGVICIYLTLPWHWLKLPSRFRTVPFAIVLIYVCPAILLPWQQEIYYGAINTLNALLLDSLIIGMYGSFLFGIFKSKAYIENNFH